jgi:RsiW-degrading membrane proteinase PrsW (M82 family)
LRFDSRLLTPPQEKEEVYPYRRVWRSIAFEHIILVLIAVTLYILVAFIGIQMPRQLYQLANIVLALLPALFWLAFSWSAERSAPQPRERLLTIALVSALVANAVGVPIIDNVLRVDEWLPLSSAIDRIIGYTFTVGIVQELLKYLVVRYLAWPNHFRTRLDGVAYTAATAVGYATALNLNAAFANAASPDVAAIRVFSTLAIQTAASIIVGYGLAETLLGRPTFWLLMLTLALAAFVNGVAIPLRAGLVNAALALGVSAGKPIQGLAFSAVVLAAIGIALAFVFENAERREQEATAGQEQ